MPDTATSRIEAGSGSVRHTTGGGLRICAKTERIVPQRPREARSQPTACPSPTTTICFTALLPLASVTAAAASAAGARIVPCVGLSDWSVSRRTRRSETGTGFITSGTGPPRMMEKAVCRPACSRYLPASSIASSKLLLPSGPTMHIEDEPSMTSATSLFAPPPKRLRLSCFSKSVAAATSAPMASAATMQSARHFG